MAQFFEYLGENQLKMKKIINSFLVCGLLLATTGAYAQTTVGQDLKNAGKDVGKAGKKVGNKTAEVASKGASKVADQQLKDKVGPNGEVIYVNGKEQYYWVDGKGKHQFISKSELKDKY